MPQDDNNRRFELAKYRLELAEEDLQVAKENYEGGHLRAANNRAYYSIYHAITAVLALEQIAFRRHKDTLGYFNREYVKTEIFPRELGHQIMRAEDVRHSSDYDDLYVISDKETQEMIECAQKLFKLVGTYINNFNSGPFANGELDT